MKLTIYDFQDNIHALILSRGQDYFSKGLVKNLHETTNGWAAQVGDKSQYKVVLEGEKTFDTWDCECPFDHGPVCKHIAATIYQVRDHYQYIQEEVKLAHSILDKIPNEEIGLFVKSYLEQNKVFRKHFLATYYKFDEEK